MVSDELDAAKHFVRFQAFIHQQEASQHFADRAVALMAKRNTGVWHALRMQDKEVRVVGYGNANLVERKRKVVRIVGTAETGFDRRGDINPPTP